MEEIKVVKSKFMRNVFDQNTYVLESKKGVVLIDAGAEVEDIKAVIGDKKVVAVLMTHLHFDHFWNIEEYVKEWGCDVYVIKGEDVRFENVDLNASYMIRSQISKNIDQKFIKYYAEKTKVLDFEFNIIKTPGHTSDGVCILWKDNLFSGDTVFADGIGRTDLKDSNPFEMKESLQKILNLNFKTVYPGHYGSASKEQIVKEINYYI